MKEINGKNRFTSWLGADSLKLGLNSSSTLSAALTNLSASWLSVRACSLDELQVSDVLVPLPTG